LLLHNQATAVVAKARGSYREPVHRLKILSDFYAQIEVKGVEALLAGARGSGLYLANYGSPIRPLSAKNPSKNSIVSRKRLEFK
jgi:hypothetical protein